MAITRATWFENTIAYNLLKEATNTGRNNGLIRGSSIGSKCPRKIAYMLLGYAEYPQNAHSQYVLGFGNAFHDMVQTWMSKMGLVNATPYLDENHSLQWKGDAEGTILNTEDGVIGHYDGLSVPLLPEGMFGAINSEGKRYLLEFKTISNRAKTICVFLKDFGTHFRPSLHTVKYVLPPGKTLYSELPPLEGSKPKLLSAKGNEYFQQIVDDEKLPDGSLLDVYNQAGAFSQLKKPKDEHIDQATYYASQLNADAILIVYLAKDFDEKDYTEENLLNIPIKAFELDVEEKVIQKLQEKTKLIWSKLEEGKKSKKDPETWLPDRAFHPEDMFSDCKFCNFSYTCYPTNSKVREWTAEKFKQQAVLNLPIATGKPFEKHSSTGWGRSAAKRGKIKDSHGQQDTVSNR